MGQTEVPADPHRVVVLTNEGTEALLALGVTPVGAANSRLGDPWYPHIADAVAGTEPVGMESAVNLEPLAALKTDLIPGNMQRHEETFGQLSAIAPTVLSGRLRGDWRGNVALHAEALGRGADGDAILAAHDARVAARSSALGSHLAEEVLVIRFLAGNIRICRLDSFPEVVRVTLTGPDLAGRDAGCAGGHCKILLAGAGQSAGDPARPVACTRKPPAREGRSGDRIRL